MDGRTTPLMDRKVVGVVFFGVVAMVTSPTTTGCSVVCCSVVVVFCSVLAVVVAVADVVVV
jgi:hypothetical protein